MRKWCDPSARTAAWAKSSALFAMLTLGTACSASAGDTAPSAGAATGTVVMDWTVNAGKDPAECQLSGATTFGVKLYNSGGAFAGEFVQSCSAFATTIDGLVPDTYTGGADLRDSSGATRTTTVSLAPFTVVGNTTRTVSVDFPANSFL